MLRRIILTSLLIVPAMGNAMVTFNTWNSNEAPNGNYILTVTESAADVFDFNLTVDPWNAEALGLFIDFGIYNVPSIVLSNESPAGQVAIYDTDSTDDICGNGCNLNGLALPTIDDWELIFSLGNTGFQGIQTFSFTVSGLSGVDESNIINVGIRAQNLCTTAGEVLPNCINNGNEGSDKVYFASNGGGDPTEEVPEPGVLALLGIGLLGIASSRKTKVA